MTVLDGSFVSVDVDTKNPATSQFLASMNLASQPRQNLKELYQSWMERCEAYAAARLSGRFTTAANADAAERRRNALAEHARLSREIASLRARAGKETQLNRRVEINLEVNRLESGLDKNRADF